MIAIDLRTVARALGGNVAGRNSVVAPGPGHSPHDRSLSVRLDADAPDGFVVNSFSGDDWVLCRDYVRQRLGLPEWQPGDEQSRHVPPSRMRDFDRMTINHQANVRVRTEEDLERITRATKLWGEGRDPQNTVAEYYLRSRSLALPPELAGKVLRFHPRCPWRNEDTGTTERIPAMLTAFRSIDDDQITAVHRIRLDQPQRWPKADRRMLGIVQRAAVKLDPLGGTTLCIGEGVETSLAARQLGLKPTWALGSVGAISFFPLISGIKNLTILGETGSASKEAARLCARRWRHGFRHVQVAMPEVGSDLNDALMMGNSR
jgi:putative DNA primase/helicase